MYKGSLVELKPLSRDYIPLFLKWFNDPEVTQFLLMFRPMVKESEEEWFSNAMKNPNQIVFSIHTLLPSDNTQMIGNCGVILNWKDHSGNVGITIGEKRFWGKGFGTDAMRLLVDYCFNTLNLDRVELSVYDFNTRAFKSYLKLGFIEEGRKRKNRFINGKYCDEIFMGVLRTEWKNGDK